MLASRQRQLKEHARMYVSPLLPFFLHCRIIELLGLEKTLKDHLVQPSSWHQYYPLNQIPKYHVQSFIKHPQGQ